MDRPKRSEKRATCEGQEGGYIRKETDDIADAHATVKRWEENVEGPCPSDSLNEDEVMSIYEHHLKFAVERGHILLGWRVSSVAFTCL